MCTIQQQRVADRQQLRAPVVYLFAPFVDTFPVGFTCARKRETWEPQYRTGTTGKIDQRPANNKHTGHVWSINIYLPAFVLNVPLAIFFFFLTGGISAPTQRGREERAR